MAVSVDHGRDACLERSCGPAAGDWVRIAPSRPGLERIEAFFSGHAFEPHRHDTYAIGYTLGGVQAFGYRGATERCLPGQAFVLHPDETHDGRAGTAAGFRYRILYVEPRLIQHASPGPRRSLPFVRQPVSWDPRLASAIRRALDDLDGPLEDLEADAILPGLAEALADLDRSVPRGKLSPRHVHAVDKAREALDAGVEQGVTSADLEAVTGLSRYALTRHFRACLGTSPHRYLVMRRLDRARSLLLKGASLADAALRSGFADQSHMTRHFKKAHGVPPGRWAGMLRRT